MIRQRLQTVSKDAVSCVRFDNGAEGSQEDSMNYAFIGQKNRLALYNLSSGVEVLQYETFTNANVNTIGLWSTDNIVSGSNQILIHDKMKSVPLRKFENLQLDYRGKTIRDLKVLSDNGIILSCDIDLKIWDLRQQNKYKPIQEFQNHSKDFLNSCDYNNSNNDFLVSCGGNDGKLYTYDLRQGLLKIDNKFNGNPITRVSYKHGGKDKNILINALNQGTVIFDVEDESVVYQLKTDKPDTEYKIDSCFLPDGGFISGSEHGKLYTYSKGLVSSITVCNEEKGHNGLLLGALDVSRRSVLVGSGTGMLYTLQLAQDQP